MFLEFLVHDVKVARITIALSHGLYGRSLYSYGLCSYGRYRYGLYRYRLDSSLGTAYTCIGKYLREVAPHGWGGSTYMSSPGKVLYEP